MTALLGTAARVLRSACTLIGVAVLLSLLAGPIWSWSYFGYPFTAPAAPAAFQELAVIERLAWICRRPGVGGPVVFIEPLGGERADSAALLDRIREPDRSAFCRLKWSALAGKASVPLLTMEDVDRLVAALEPARDSGRGPPDTMVGPVAVGTTRSGRRMLLASVRGSEVSNDHFPYVEAAVDLDAEHEKADGTRFFVDISGKENIDAGMAALIAFGRLAPLLLCGALLLWIGRVVGTRVLSAREPAQEQ